jgi:hypothetical protein
MELFPQTEQQEQPLFTQEKMPTVPGNLDEVATQAALVQQSHTGQDYLTQIAQSKSDIEALGIDEVRRTIAQKEKSVELQVAEDSVRKSNPQTLPDVTQYYQDVLQRHAGPADRTALERAAVEIVTPKDAESYYNQYNIQEGTKNLAARNILYESLYDNTESANFWDKVFNFGKDLIPFVNSRSVSKAVSEALNKDSRWTDSINPKNIVEEFRSSYLNADPEKRKQLVQALVHGIDKYSSLFGDKNAATAAHNMEKVLAGTRAEFNETTAFDTLNLPLVTLGKYIFKGAQVALELGKPANVAIKAGNAETAVGMMAKDALTKSKVSGMDAAEIARQATSMNVSPLEVQFVDLKVAQQLQEKLRDYGLQLRTNVENTLRASGQTPDELERADELVKELYSSARNKSVYEFTPSNFENGNFTGTVKWQSADGVPFQSREMAEGWGVEKGKYGQALEVNKPELSPEELNMINEGGREPPSSGQWIFAENVREPTPLDSIGMFSKEDIQGRNFFNFNIPFFSGSKQIVNERGVAASANAKIRRDLETAYKDAVSGLGGGSRAKVTSVLAEGDNFSNKAGAMGYVFKQEELEARGLNNKEIESYYKQRMIRDTMWLMRNKQMVEEFRADGVKELAFDGNNFMGPLNRPVKPLDSGSIKSLVTQGKVGKVMDTRNGTISTLNTDEIDNIYNGGGQVVRLYKPEGIGTRKYTHLIVDNNQAQIRDIHVAVPFRPGEFARVYSDEYFVTLRRQMLDEFDNKDYATETIRTAKNAKEAADYAAAHNAALKVALDQDISTKFKMQRLEQLVGKYMNPKEFLKEVKERGLKQEDIFDFHYNRETHSYLADTIDEALTNGRLFYSYKGEKLLSVDAARTNTLNITDSLGVELANISRFITSKDIRVTAIERWMNTFGDGVVNRTFNKWTDFDKGELSADLIKKGLLDTNPELAKLSGDELLKFAEQTRKYIRQQLGIRTADQKLNEVRFRKAIEWMEGKSGLQGKFLDWFGPAMRNMEFADFLRKVNFHITLGMGNIAQLLVQANGMFIGAAVHPIHGLGAAKVAIPLRMALMSDNPAVWKGLATVDSLTSLGLKNTNEFVDIVKAIRKSGVLDDIRSTALYNVEDGALDLYKGYGKQAFKEASPFFFNRGEEFSRLVSWEVARREFKSQHPGVDWTGDDALKEILIRQREFNLGMQSHNTAAWQKGWAGVPMQFLQYNIKLAASLMHTAAQFGKEVNAKGVGAFTNFDNGVYRGFNPAQALRLLGAQIVLYGAAGNGLKSVADQLWGDKDTGMDEETKMYISEGLAGGLFYSLTKAMDEAEPAKLALGQRLGSFNWYSDMWDKIVHDKTDVTDFLFGVTKSSGTKAIDVVKGLARVLRYSDEVTPELVVNEFSKMPEMVASWSNALKAYQYMQNEGVATSKFGTPVARLNAKENLAAYLGIGSVQIQEYYQSVKDERRLHQDLSELANHVRDLQRRELEARLNDNNTLADELEKMRWAMMPRDLGHREIVDQILREKLWPGDTQLDKLRRKFEGLLNQEQEHFRVLDKGQ